MKVSVLRRDRGEEYLYRMLFQNREFNEYHQIMPHVQKHHGYELRDEFLILVQNSSRRVVIIEGDIMPEWGDV